MFGCRHRDGSRWGTLISWRCFKGCVEGATGIKIMQLFIVGMKRYPKLRVASNELNGCNEDRAVLCDAKGRCRCRCKCRWVLARGVFPRGSRSREFLGRSCSLGSGKTLTVNVHVINCASGRLVPLANEPQPSASLKRVHWIGIGLGKVAFIH
jgi:hypothetical protein